MAETRQPNDNLAELQKSEAEKILPAKHFKKEERGENHTKECFHPATHTNFKIITTKILILLVILYQSSKLLSEISPTISLHLNILLKSLKNT